MIMKEDTNLAPSYTMQQAEPEAVDLIEKVKALLPKDGSSSFDREQLLLASQKLSISLETPGETVQRLAYLPMITAACRIGNRLGLFKILTTSDGPRTVTELAKETNTDYDLLIRLLRYLAATLSIREVDVETYTANSTTHNMVVRELQAGVDHTFDTVDQAVMVLPAFLQETHYRNPTDPKHCPFQKAMHTEDILFEWFPKHPELLNNFNMWMMGQRVGRPYWLDFFPFEERLADGFTGGKDDVMMVDVGGARGHEVQAVKAKYPSLPGRFVLQDLPETIRGALEVPGMEKMVYDFFTPQPIQGARVYYLRSIMHDWPDDKCVEILQHLATAMKRGYSKILINEMVVPNKGASLVTTQVDITMMVALAACERTETQWRKLIGSAGLTIEKITTEQQETESIIEAVLP